MLHVSVLQILNRLVRVDLSLTLAKSGDEVEDLLLLLSLDFLKALDDVGVVFQGDLLLDLLHLGLHSLNLLAQLDFAH